MGTNVWNVWRAIVLSIVLFITGLGIGSSALKAVTREIMIICRFRVFWH